MIVATETTRAVEDGVGAVVVLTDLDPSADAQAVADGMAAFLADRLSRYKHPESFEAVAVGLRDERAGWLKQNRDFPIMPVRARAKVE